MATRQRKLKFKKAPTGKNGPFLPDWEVTLVFPDGTESGPIYANGRAFIKLIAERHSSGYYDNDSFQLKTDEIRKKFITLGKV